MAILILIASVISFFFGLYHLLKGCNEIYNAYVAEKKLTNAYQEHIKLLETMQCSLIFLLEGCLYRHPEETRIRDTMETFFSDDYRKEQYIAYVENLIKNYQTSTEMKPNGLLN